MGMTKRWTAVAVCWSLLVLVQGCGSLRYVDVSPDARDFHPKSIAVLPVDAGSYGEAREVIDQLITEVLIDTKWYEKVVTAGTVRNHMAASGDTRKAVSDYLTKLKMLNFSDPELSRKIGDTVDAEALLVANVDHWLYTTEGDKKIAKAGLGIKLVEAQTGKILWKAIHYDTESYTLFKPAMQNVAKGLARKMISEMPH